MIFVLILYHFLKKLVTYALYSSVLLHPCVLISVNVNLPVLGGAGVPTELNIGLLEQSVIKDFLLIASLNNELRMLNYYNHLELL